METEDKGQSWKGLERESDLLSEEETAVTAVDLWFHKSSHNLSMLLDEQQPHFCRMSRPVAMFVITRGWELPKCPLVGHWPDEIIDVYPWEIPCVF